MAKVIQLFDNSSARRVHPKERKQATDKFKLNQRIYSAQRILDIYTELVYTLRDPRDIFVAKNMVRDCQRDVDVLVAEYTGRFGALAI
jgi:hypothetical protein